MALATTRTRRHWPDLPAPPHGTKIMCVGNYRPPGADVHGTHSNFTAGCRCERCRRGVTRYHRYLDYKHGVLPPPPRPARIPPWRSGWRAGGAWRLIYAVLYR